MIWNSSVWHHNWHQPITRSVKSLKPIIHIPDFFPIKIWQMQLSCNKLAKLVNALLWKWCSMLKRFNSHNMDVSFALSSLQCINEIVIDAPLAIICTAPHCKPWSRCQDMEGQTGQNKHINKYISATVAPKNMMLVPLKRSHPPRSSGTKTIIVGALRAEILANIFYKKNWEFFGRFRECGSRHLILGGSCKMQESWQSC